MKILEEVKGAKSIGITGHVRPDGDCIGACMAMYLFLKKALPDVQVHVFLEEIPTIYYVIKETEQIEDAEEFEKKQEKIDTFIILDCAIDRTGAAEKLACQAGRTINIDHHMSNANGSGMVNYVVPTASSASELVYDVIEEDLIDVEIAKAIYIGMINDTGVFQYSNTSQKTMEIAGKLITYGFDFPALIQKTFYEKTYVQNQIMGRALLESILFMDGRCIVSSIDRKTMEFYDAKPKHLDGIVSQLRNTRGVDCAIFMYETGALEYKVSLRSNEKVNVAEVAEHFGGGGHVRAAGCTVSGTFHDVVNNLSQYIEKQLKGNQ